MKKFFGTILMIIGFVGIMGVVGSDCDGECMQYAMSIEQTIVWGAGFVLTFIAGLTQVADKTWFMDGE